MSSAGWREALTAVLRRPGAAAPAAALAAPAPTGATTGVAAPRRMLSLRLLPVTVLAMGAMLAAKSGEVWDDVRNFSETFGVSAKQAVAQAQPSDPARGGAKPPTAQMQQQQQAAAPPTAELPRDPTRFSQSEIDLLQALASRRDLLEKRERELAQREALLQAAERRVEEKVSELEGVKSELLRLIGKRNEEEDARLRSLVRIYEAMKPKEAAQILEKLDTDVLIGVVERMKENKVAPILAAMQPERAKAVTALLADRKDVSVKAQ